MDVKATLLWTTGLSSHHVDQDLLLGGRQVLFPEEDDPSLGDERGEVSDELGVLFAGISRGRREDGGELKGGREFGADGGGDIDGLRILWKEGEKCWREFERGGVGGLCSDGHGVGDLTEVCALARSSDVWSSYSYCSGWA
jgi:hypothetical protein